MADDRQRNAEQPPDLSFINQLMKDLAARKAQGGQ